jgi:CheY-like chemotaxis protein/anti-sigma regulatory factor (Ser/Thr protein kinase)
LIELLSDILDLSKIEADRLEIEWIPCDVISLVDDMVSMLRVKAQEKALTLTVEYRGKIPQFVRTDPTRLRQILLNLLGNAIKFTERGGVRIVVTGQAVQDPDCQLEFEVIDTGIGIESAQLARLFQPFAQADSSLTRRFGGTGLGLIISRRLAQLLGGDVAVRSTYGEGSVFSLKLRARAQSGASLEVAPCEAVHGLPKTTSVPEPDLQGCQVLLVEDGPDNQRLIAAILQRAGVVVTIAEHGAQALEQVSAEEQRLVNFDLVLMDMQMPVLDGYAATRELRRRGFERPIVALTAHASALDREKCLACGCNDFATKPIDRRNLLNLISRWRQPNCKGSPAGAN